jgi:2-dehydropantoate 2-reductase
MNKPSIVIFGSGAMACLFAARLASTGQQVCMVDEWIVGLNTIREKGIFLRSGNQQIHQHVLTCSPGEKPPDCDYALVLVKSWQTAWAADQIQTCLAPDGLAITLQNGLGNDLILKQKLGNNRVSVGVTTLGATLSSPGNVTGFENGITTFQNQAGMMGFLSILESAHFNLSIDDSINRLVWGKLIINAAINPLTALLGIPNGKLLEIPSALQLMEQIAAEAEMVCTSLGISLPYTNPIQQIISAAKATSQNYSSMLQDIQRSAPTEIDQINGAISALGQQNGIPTPYNQSVTALVKARVALYPSR